MTRSDFVAGKGLAFLAHRLRRLSEQLVGQAELILREEGLATPPRAVSTIQLLHEQGALSVTEIASALKFSHPLILKLVQQLDLIGLVRTSADADDRRRRIVTLTARGHGEAERLLLVNDAMAASYRQILATLGVDALGLVDALDADCRSGDFALRVRRALSDTWGDR